MTLHRLGDWKWQNKAISTTISLWLASEETEQAPSSKPTSSAHCVALKSTVSGEMRLIYYLASVCHLDFGTHKPWGFDGGLRWGPEYSALLTQLLACLRQGLCSPNCLCTLQNQG